MSEWEFDAYIDPNTKSEGNSTLLPTLHTVHAHIQPKINPALHPTHRPLQSNPSSGCPKTVLGVIGRLRGQQSS